MRTNVMVVLLSVIFGVVMVSSVVGCGADMGAPIDENIDQPVEPTPPLAAPVISWTMSRHLPGGGTEIIDADSTGYILREGTDYTLSIATDWDEDEVVINLIVINCTVLERTSRSVTFRYDLPDGQCRQDVASFVEATRTTQQPIRCFRDSKIVQAIVVAN